MRTDASITTQSNPIAARPVRITETAFRDGHQSLLATRMKTEDMLKIADKVDSVGYFSLEVWGDVYKRQGMVLCVEVGKYVPEVGGFQVEDTVVVTESGIEVLSSLPKTLALSS